MSAFAAPNRSGARGYRGHSGIPEQPSRLGRLNHCCHLQGSLADRAVLQGAEAEPEDQYLCGHLGQRRQDSDLDSIDRHAPAAVPAIDVAFRLESVEPGRALAHESVYASRPYGMASRALPSTARSQYPATGRFGLRLMLDSNWRRQHGTAHNLSNSPFKSTP